MTPLAVRTPSVNPAAAVATANMKTATAYRGGRSGCTELLSNQPIAKALADSAAHAAIPLRIC